MSTTPSRTRELANSADTLWGISDTPYGDPGGDYFTRLNPDKAKHRALDQLHKMGYSVTLESLGGCWVTANLRVRGAVQTRGLGCRSRLLGQVGGGEGSIIPLRCYRAMEHTKRGALPIRHRIPSPVTSNATVQ